jgi:hypothetical protein
MSSALKRVLSMASSKASLRVPRTALKMDPGTASSMVRMMGQRLVPSWVRRKVRRMAGKMAAETASTMAKSTERG